MLIILSALIMVGVLFLFYKILTVMYCRYILFPILKGSTVSDFVRVLGSNFRCRLVYTGAIRYKWTKGWIIIRATFDDEGRLLDISHKSFELTSFITSYSF